MRLRSTILAVELVLAGGGAVRAAPEEIQVYMDEMNERGQFGLDLYTNFVATGRPLDDYAGERQSLHTTRITPEFSYGLTSHLELGLYLPLATIGGGGRPRAEGIKFRAKYMVSRPKEAKWFYGANFEIGRVDHALDPNPYNAELKLIVGRHSGRWTFANNINTDFKVDGPERAPTTLDVDTKLGYAIDKRWMVGFETYNGAGQYNALGSFGRAEHSTFAVVDRSFGRWDANFGIGSGYGANRDGVIVKFIIGVPIDYRSRRS